MTDQLQYIEDQWMKNIPDTVIADNLNLSHRGLYQRYASLRKRQLRGLRGLRELDSPESQGE